MNDTLNSRLAALIKKSGMSARALSIAAGLSPDTIGKQLKNEDQLPTMRTLNAIARVLNVQPQTLLHGQDEGAAGSHPAPGSQPAQDKTEPLTPIGNLSVPKDVPLMGTAAGNHLRGAFIMGSEPIDYVGRPPALVSTRDLYALFVEGNSMQPQYQPGDLIFVNPNKPPKRGDPVVVQRKRVEDGSIEATIGLFVRTSGSSLYIQKHNPNAEIEVPLAYVTAVHRILTTNEMFGA